MVWEKEFVKLVKIEFQRRKLKNPRFSVRQYAKKLDLSIGALSEVLNGKRQLTRSRALKVMANLDTAPAQIERIHMLMGETPEPTPTNQAPLEPLHELQEIIPDWRNFVVLSALYHPEAAKLIPRISRFTELSEEEVQQRLNSFKEKIPSETDYLNFQIDALKSQSRIFTGESLGKFHQGQIELLKKASTDRPPDNLLFCNVTLGTSKKQYEKVKSELRQTFLRLISIEPDGAAEKFYQVSLQMASLDSE